MKNWIPQIAIGIIVTIVGTVIANTIVTEYTRHAFPGSHFSVLTRHGR